MVAMGARLQAGLRGLMNDFPQIGEARGEPPDAGGERADRGETIRTEISCKYDVPSIAALFAAAGLRLESWKTDPEHRFALVVGAPA